MDDVLPGSRVGRGGRHRSRRGRFLLRGGVTWRHGQPHDVGARSGVPLRNARRQRGHLRMQHGLRADDASKWLQPAVVVTRGRTLEHEPVDVLTGEPHLHPRARHRGGGVLDGDGVVERAVEVGEGYVDQHPGHGIDARPARTPQPCGPGSPRPWPSRRPRTHAGRAASLLARPRGWSWAAFNQRPPTVRSAQVERCSSLTGLGSRRTPVEHLDPVLALAELDQRASSFSVSTALPFVSGDRLHDLPAIHLER